MKKNVSCLPGRVYVIEGSEKKLWYAMDLEQHAEFYLNDEETERIKKQVLDRIQNTCL